MDTDNQQERLPESRFLGWYLSGFVDGEGSFNVSCKPHPSMKYGWAVDQVFQVYQHKNNVQILEILKNFLHCGRIKPKSPTSNTMVLIVDNRRTIVEKVLPFFDEYRLLSKKKLDFKKFKLILGRMEKKEHLELSGLKEIIKIACSMNQKGKQRKYSEKYILETLAKSSETAR